MSGTSQPSTSKRVVILASFEFNGWELPPFAPSEQAVWMSGGHRWLIEVGAAAAAAGYPVELRGTFIEREVGLIERAAAVELGRPQGLRSRTESDIVIIPEGLPDPLLFAREILSPARAVLAVLGPLGLFGWSFERDWRPPDLLTVDPNAVGRPGQLSTARRLGLEIWTCDPVSEQARTLGLRHHHVGGGRPDEYPEPPAKRVDVVTLSENKWAPLVPTALAGLRPEVSRIELPRMPREQLLLELGVARTFIHPVRIEGRSRLCEEARAMGTVPIMLRSNRFGEGLNPASGGIAVDTIEEIAPAVHELLDNPSRLREIARAGYREARIATRWQPFVERVAAALAEPDREPASFAPARAVFGAQLHAREDAFRAELTRQWQELADVRAEQQRLASALAAAERGYLALRERRAVRAGLSLARVYERLRAVCGRS